MAPRQGEASKGIGMGQETAGNGTRFVGVLSLALAVFLLFTGGRAFVLSCVNLWRVFGLHDSAEDFNLERLAGFGLLAFGAQLAFGLYFGGWTARFEAARHAGWAPGSLAINPAVLWLFVWLVLLNVPYLCELWRVLHVPGMWASMRAHHLPLWPPRRLYAPLASDLVAFLPLGNLGLFVGFLGAFGAARLRGVVPSRRDDSN
jgi:hypothetical protein